MNRPTKADAVDFLLQRKFSGYRDSGYQKMRPPATSSNSQYAVLSAAEKRKWQQEAEAYKKELQSKSREELWSLYKQEQTKHQDELRRKTDLEEKQRFYNLPSTKADFVYWSKATYWWLDEAIALLFGKAPESVNWERVKGYVEQSPFGREYARVRDLALRAKACKELSDPVSPGVFLVWANRLEFSVPKELVLQVDKRAVTTDWKDRYDKLKVEFEKLGKEYLALHEKLSRSELSSSGNHILRENKYWQELKEKAERAISHFPSWSAKQEKIQKSGNLQDWLCREINADSREAEILKKILSDAFQELK